MTIQKLRRPSVSPLSVLGVLAGLALVSVLAYYAVQRFREYMPSPEALALYQRGVEAMREGEFYKASGLLEQAVKTDDSFALAHARLAEALTEMDFLERAQSEMIVADGLVAERQTLRREDALYFRAVRATVGHRPAEAVKAYEELARQETDQPQVEFDLGRAYDKNDETDKAINAFTRATSHAPDYAAAFVSLGVLHARQRNLPGATNAFQLAEKLYGANGNREGLAEVHFQHGRVLSDLRKKDEARRELQQAFDLARSTNNLYQQVQAMLQLAYVQPNPEDGLALARDAVELAQANSMSNLVIYGHIVRGNVFMGQNRYEEAERDLNRALELARSYKVPRLEAYALGNISNLRTAQNRTEEAIKFASEARDFYQKASYRRDADSAAIILARLKGQQGDYDGALGALKEQLGNEEQSSADMQMIASLQRECGSMLAKQGRFAESVDHYRDSISIAKTLHDDLLLSYSLLNLANSLWRLGRDPEAADLLAQLTAMADRPGSPNKDMLARVRLTEANMALSRDRFDEVASKGGEALALAEAVGGRKDIAAEADAVMCLAQAFGGSAARGRALCQQSARTAEETKDPWFVSLSQLALAQDLLEAGDARGARDAALRAEEFFSRSGHVEAEWRALAVAGGASRRAGDQAAAQDYFARARASLSRLEQSWAADAPGYLGRADVQRLRRELGDETVAEVR